MRKLVEVGLLGRHPGVEGIAAWVMVRALLGLSWLLVFPLAVQAGAARDCQALRHQRDATASEAMASEIALVHGVRLRLCPQLELLADEAHAPEKPGASGQASGSAAASLAASAVASGSAQPLATTPPFDYTAYIACRHQAERQLQRTSVVLYRNQQDFSFYTVDGARLAREADALATQLRAACDSPATVGPSR